MEKCEHNTSKTIANGYGMSINLCTWDCQKLFFAYNVPGGLTRSITRDEIEELRVELNELRGYVPEYDEDGGQRQTIVDAAWMNKVVEERDALRAEREELNKLRGGIVKLVEERDALRDELNYYKLPKNNDMRWLQYKNYQMEQRIAEQSIKLMLFDAVVAERDAFRTALSAIVTANATMQDMSQSLEDARRLLENSQ